MDNRTAVSNWGNAQSVDSLNIAIQKIIDFMNHFENHTRFQLSTVGDRLNLLEQEVHSLEQKLNSLKRD
ncbi:hypothetical protein H696_03849 [Fonticula alba]|uniref:Uncharacterized protein n=1 Tax=Fonticula alba TaxID=691883 RepID=A0A058Z574_FONAL|nr:hypothetical protein H696_03849 [Fonticula alba]KCV69419.1 hypothetical protein H696_03849 [Fonticula alba]|eukprot:XP_009495984.1 hypothetical protein H696_03849 [Fonticula alba]